MQMATGTSGPTPAFLQLRARRFARRVELGVADGTLIAVRRATASGRAENLLLEELVHAAARLRDGCGGCRSSRSSCGALGGEDLAGRQIARSGSATTPCEERLEVCEQTLDRGLVKQVGVVLERGTKAVVGPRRASGRGRTWLIARRARPCSSSDPGARALLAARLWNWKSTWKSGEWLRLALGFSSATSFSNGRSWCAYALRAVSRVRRRSSRKRGVPREVDAQRERVGEEADELLESRRGCGSRSACRRRHRPGRCSARGAPEGREQGHEQRRSFGTAERLQVRS